MKFNYRTIGLKRIDMYIIGKFLGTFFFSLVLILSIAVVFDMTEKMDDFFDNHAPLSEIVFDYYFSFIPFYMNMFTPLFTFIAVIFFTSKLAGDTEIIAILASGVSFRRLMFPYFVSATVICAMSFVLGGYIIPKTNETMLVFSNKYIKEIKRNHVANIQMAVEPGVVFYVSNYEQQNNQGANFSLDKFDGKTLVSRLTAERITWDSAYVWTLYNYTRRDFNGMHEVLTQGEKIDTIIAVQPYEFFITSKEAPEMNNTQLSSYLTRQKSRGVGNIQVFQDEYYKRFSMPLAAFIMTLIGVSLSSRKVRGGIGLHLGVGLGLSAIYILFVTVSSTFSASGAMSVGLAVWLPNIVFTLIGAYLYHTAPK
ncbi:MAG: LptF/LptG family permease [Prevotellaceae bacterium]|jgi:lipopolysaccharide export system permease protein|nr:LptF/LptG family permease [Prevotellaceae bacterium]